MSFVWVFVNKSLTLPVSDLTVLQSWFLSEGNEVFFSDMIRLMLSTFVFPLESVFALVCLQWMDYCHVVFCWKFLAFHCLVSWLLYKCLWMCLPMYLFLDFQNFNVRKPPILYYWPKLVSEYLVFCLHLNYEHLPQDFTSNKIFNAF